MIPNVAVRQILVAGAIVAALGAAMQRTTSAQDIIVDNADAGFAILSGNWTTGTVTAGKYGADYAYASTVSGAATAECEWRASIATAGYYEVAAWYTQGANRAIDSPFSITHAHGSGTASIDQTTNGGGWRVIGVFEFQAGNNTARVALKNSAEAGKIVMADAVRFRRVTLAAGEFRGFWASRFEWPSANAATMKANLRRMMDDAVRGGFNNVVVQFRGQGDVMYPSPNEVWSPLVGGADPGFDPLRFAIDEAHGRGLRFHCYFNTHVIWGSASPPSNGNHLYFQHGNPADPAHRDWLIADASGVPQSAQVDGYFWIAPGVPAAQAYLRAQVMHLVNTYPDLDGIHFDRIRTPGTEYSHDAISTARMAGDGNPDGLGFADWTRDQFTRFLADTYAEVREKSATIQLSSAPLGLYEASRYPGYSTGYLYGKTKVYQDAQAWLAAGAQDWIAPQIYWADGGSKPDFSEVLPDWVANAAGRHIYPGMDADAAVARTQAEIQAARTLGASGQQYWSYGTASTNDHFTALKAAEYSQYAAQPELPWLSNPTVAIIIGTVTDFTSGQPVTDAHITRTGSNFTALSSADGLYSFLLVPPGNYTLSATKTGVGDASAVVNGLAAGDVRRVNLMLAPPGTPTQLAISSAPANAGIGVEFDVTIEVRDSTGDLVTTGSTNVQLSATGGGGNLSGTTSGTTVNGTLTLRVNYNALATITLTASDTAANLQAASATIDIAPGAGNGNNGGCGTRADSTASAGFPMALLAVLLAALGLARGRRLSPRVRAE